MGARRVLLAHDQKRSSLWQAITASSHIFGDCCGKLWAAGFDRIICEKERAAPRGSGRVVFFREWMEHGRVKPANESEAWMENGRVNAAQIGVQRSSLCEGGSGLISLLALSG